MRFERVRRITYRPDPAVFVLFVAIGLFYVNYQQWPLLLAIVPVVLIFWKRGTHLVYDFLLCLPFLLMLLRPDNIDNNGLGLARQIDTLTGYSLRTEAMNAIRGDRDAVWLAKLMVFNERTGHQEQYNQLKQLAILHMMVVSGSHLSMIAAFVCWCFRGKAAWVGKLLAALLLGTYVYTLDFALASMRALISFLLAISFKRYGLKGTGTVALTMALMLAMNPRFIFAAGFQLSFMTAFFIAHFAQHVHIKNFVVKGLAVALLATVVTMPIMASFTKTVSALGIVYNLVFGLLMPPLFIYYALFSYVPFLAPVSNSLASCLIETLKIASQFNLFLALNQQFALLAPFYYLALLKTTDQSPTLAGCARVVSVGGVAVYSLL